MKRRPALWNPSSEDYRQNTKNIGLRTNINKMTSILCAAADEPRGKKKNSRDDKPIRNPQLRRYYQAGKHRSCEVSLRRKVRMKRVRRKKGGSGRN